MTSRNEIYKCEICGNIVEVLHEAGGQLVCCGEPMKLLKENEVDASKEKHVPVIEKEANIFKIKVGSIPHPMQPEHYIEWIELIADNKIFRKFLNPGENPEAEFCLDFHPKHIIAREYCNLHGLWKG
jgi:superoxide reductase